MGRYAHRFPDADVVLFEPPRDEYTMFFSNMFSFRSRRRMCELAYETTRRDLLARRDVLGPVLAKHGIAMRIDALEDATRDVWDGAALGDEPAELVLAEFDAAVARLGERINRSPGRQRR